MFCSYFSACLHPALFHATSNFTFMHVNILSLYFLHADYATLPESSQVEIETLSSTSVSVVWAPVQNYSYYFIGYDHATHALEVFPTQIPSLIVSGLQHLGVYSIFVVTVSGNQIGLAIDFYYTLEASMLTMHDV